MACGATEDSTITIEHLLEVCTFLDECPERELAGRLGVELDIASMPYWEDMCCYERKELILKRWRASAFTLRGDASGAVGGCAAEASATGCDGSATYKKLEEAFLAMGRRDYAHLVSELSNPTAAMKDKENGAVMTDSAGEDGYRMNSNPHGIALIISNTEFVNKKMNITKGDEKCLESVFKHLNYKTVLLENLTKQEMKDAVRLVLQNSSVSKHFSDKLAKASDHRVTERDDSFVLVITTHGGSRGLLGSDGKRLPESCLLQELKCSLLEGKPKMVFIQACRGNESSMAVRVDGPEQEEETDSDDPPEDLIIQHSSYEGKKSYIDDWGYVFFNKMLGGGGVYAHALARTLRDMYTYADLGDMLTKVNERVHKLSIANKEDIKMCSEVSFDSLCSPVYFNPKK